MAFTTINYSDGNKKKLGYKSVEIHYGEHSGKKAKKKIFNSGDFVKDWYDCRKFMIMKLSDTEPFFTQSSSVNHFIMDGAPYDSAYLYTDGTPRLEYKVSKNIFEDDGIEFFVKEGTTPTWEELKVLCGDIKKKSKTKKVK